MSEWDASTKWINGLMCSDMRKILRQIEDKGYRLALVKGAKIKEVSPLLLNVFVGSLKGAVEELEEESNE